MKRILTIQDISCIGKCSLTVALPIISAMGVETAIIPTAVLSTHTMFDNFTFKDLADQIGPITKHWKEEGFGFDSIYTGYLGSKEQIDMIKKLFKDFESDKTFNIVDPAMGDNGKLYPAFDQDFASHMATLCAEADIIIPNLTEASFMLGKDYREDYDEEYIKEVLKDLSALGPKISILTGIGFKDGYTGAMGYDRVNDEFYHYEHEEIDVSFHGTGDIFSSTFVGSLSNDFSWKEALKIAGDYTAKAIQLTLDDKDGRWYGVNFEEAMPYLLKSIGK